MKKYPPQGQGQFRARLDEAGARFHRLEARHLPIDVEAPANRSSRGLVDVPTFILLLIILHRSPLVATLTARYAGTPRQGAQPNLLRQGLKANILGVKHLVIDVTQMFCAMQNPF